MIISRRVVPAALILLSLTLAGCAGNLPPAADETHDIELGETVRGEFATLDPQLARYPWMVNAHTYRFRAEQGTWVTATARSDGPDVELWINKGFKPFMGGVGASAFAFSEWPDGFDPTPGPHAELMVPLTKNASGEYALELRSRKAGSYTVTLTRGAAPSFDLWKVPEPLAPAIGRYPSPFTEDGTIAPWVERMRALQVAGNVGGTIGRFVAAQAGGGLAAGAGGKLVGELVAREVTLNALGGWEKIYAETDFAFDNALDLAIYMHLKHSTHPQYDEVLQAMMFLYPGFDNPILYASGRHWGRWFPVKNGTFGGPATPAKNLQ